MGTVGVVAHLQGVWELGDVDGERTHHMEGQEEESVGGNEQLACLQECGHKRAWLPLAGGKAERVCVTRRGQRNCVERELGGFKPCAKEAREMPKLVSVGEIDEDDDGEVGADLALEGGDSVPLRGHLADQLPSHELVQKQKNDEVLGQIYEFVKTENWPKIGVLRKQFHHPHVHIHRGVGSTVKAIGDRFYYLGMTDDLRTRVLSCGAFFAAKLPPPKQNNRVPQNLFDISI